MVNGSGLMGQNNWIPLYPAIPKEGHFSPDAAYQLLIND